MKDHCGSCKAPVVWVITEKGKRMPLDKEPVPNGNIIVLNNGIAHFLLKDEPVKPETKRYVSHFATCPNAGQHRKGK